MFLHDKIGEMYNEPLSMTMEVTLLPEDIKQSQKRDGISHSASAGLKIFSFLFRFIFFIPFPSGSAEIAGRDGFRHFSDSGY